MTAFIIILTLILIAVIAVQIGKLTELAAEIRGEEEALKDSNNFNAAMMLVFLVLFLSGVIFSSVYYMNEMLGYGPNISASVHGSSLDSTFNITLFFTGIVFVVTHILLFWYAYKFKEVKGRKALFMPHNNTLEVVWTAIPAVVMTFLVVNGLDTWNEVMADVSEDEEYIEIEATAQQFGWIIRYPGPDGLLGTRNYQLIEPGTNDLGLDWTDEKTHDDIISSSVGEHFYLPKDKKVRVRIIAKDVLHNFYLPHFRVKMDAVPGLPTYFVFTPNTTTEEYKARLGTLDDEGNPMYPEWHRPVDKDDPESLPRWKSFEYELACAELCGKGHFSMKRLLRIVEEPEYKSWLADQKSYYPTSVMGTDADPFKEENLKKMEAEKAKEEAEVTENAEEATEETAETAETD